MVRVSDRDDLEILCLLLAVAYFFARAAHVWYARRVARQWAEDFSKKKGPHDGSKED
jgi:hypothetical protein